MSTNKWRAEEERLLKMLLPTNTHREISEQINRRFAQKLTGFPGERSEESIRKKIAREGWKKEDFKNYQEENEVATTFRKIAAIQEEYKDRSIKLTRGVMPADQATTKILSLSDIHFPFAREDLLERAINDNSDADIVVINGDMLEGYIFSSFKKSKNIAAIHEYITAFEFVEVLSKRFKDVVIVDGNHDIRSGRLIGEGIPKGAEQVLRTNLVQRIANGERLDETGAVVELVDFKNVHYEARESWYVRIGKTLFIHPHTRGSGKPGFTVNAVGEKLLKRYPDGDVDSVVCGHTHQVYKGIVNGVLMMEQGCLADLLAYVWKPNSLTRKNYQNGYAVIYQDKDGNTDFNRSGVIYFGEVIPAKKEIFSKD
jgi:predicted phosphodiesterase